MEEEATYILLSFLVLFIFLNRRRRRYVWSVVAVASAVAFACSVVGVLVGFGVGSVFVFGLQAVNTSIAATIETVIFRIVLFFILISSC